MDLGFLLKTTGGSQKIAKTKVVRETAKWRCSEGKGSETGPESARSPKRGFFCHLWILFHFLMQKDKQEKHFWKVV